MNDRLTGRSLGLLVIFAIAAYLCWLMLSPFVGVLMWAVVLVVVFYPPSETKKETTVIEAQSEIAESGQQPSV